MNNKPQMMDERDQTKILGWLYQEEEQDDFLTGRVPKDLSDMWEEEE